MSYAPQLLTYTKAMVPCLIVHHVQVHVKNWIDRQWNSREALAPPVLSISFEKMKLCIQWEIPMPVRYEEFLVVGFRNSVANPGGRSPITRRERNDGTAATPGDFGDLQSMLHPAKHLLQHYKSNGVLVMFHGKPWSEEQPDAAMKRGPHKSANEHVEFLGEDFADMIHKDQRLILPYEEVKDLPGLHLNPPGVIPQ